MNKLLVQLIVCFALLIQSMTGLSQKTDTEMIVSSFVSDDGTWLSYRKIYKNKNIQYVRDIRRDKVYQFEGLSDSRLFNDHYFLGFSYADKSLYVVDRRAARIDTVRDVQQVEWLPATSQIVYLRDSDQHLVVHSLSTKRSSTHADVSWFELSPNRDKVLFLSHGNQAGVVDVNSGKSWSNLLPDLGNVKPKKFVWDESTQSGYVFANCSKQFYLYRVAPEASSKVFDRRLVDTARGFIIDTLFSAVLLMPDQKIAFAEKPFPRSKPEQRAEIWHGTMNGLMPTFDKNSPQQRNLAIIDLTTKSWKCFGEPGRWMDFKIDQQYRIYGYEVNELDDLTKQFPDRNTSIYKGPSYQKHFIYRFKGDPRTVHSFASFPHLLYFQNNQWSFFDINHGLSADITASTDGHFYDDRWEVYQITDDAIGSIPVAYKDKGFYISDRDDIWFYDWRSGQMTRRTQGREENKQYQLASCNNKYISTPWSWANSVAMHDYKDFVLTWTSELYKWQGISLLLENGRTRKLVQDKAIYSSLVRSAGFLLYTKEKANMPPRLYLYNIQKQQETLLDSTNMWDTEAQHVRSEHFYWRNKDNQLRGGLVRFPKNYKEGEDRKYPTIVEIYHTRYRVQQEYVSPQEIEGNGINYRTYTDMDYFVIEPDIYYEIGNPGLSANVCVNETIDYLSDLFPIDTTRLGLFGHSFGGYETNFIITQTPRFKAAVSSAGVADLVGWYFGFSWEGFRPDLWRFETQQWRMGKSFFEIPDKYIANSPVHQLNKNTHTPLLLYTGKKDYQVYWEQSISMFLALKRLGKDVNLLLYPNEGHVLMNSDNRKDASDKMIQWFDHYLKGAPRAKWMDPE